MENNHAHETGKSDLINNIEDWSAYLQRIIHLERKAHHLLNLKKYKEADEVLAEIGHNSRMARVWIYSSGERKCLMIPMQICLLICLLAPL